MLNHSMMASASGCSTKLATLKPYGGLGRDALAAHDGLDVVEA
jgi:hypothetical protein